MIIKNLNMNHSSYIKDNKMFLDMLQVGIPARPSTEIVQEIAEISKANFDHLYYDKMEIMRADQAKEKSEM